MWRLRDPRRFVKAHEIGGPAWWARTILSQRARGGRRGQARLSRSSWDDLSLDEQRAYIRAGLESIYVMPSTKRGNRFDPERLVPVWRET